jgi:hypothetical protein
MPVKVQGVWQSAEPSNEICAPAGVDDIESCADTIAATA